MKFFSSAKDRKTTALSKKNMVSSVSDSYRTEVMPAYLSPPGLSLAQPGGVHSAWNILFNFALPLLPLMPNEWHPLTHGFLELHTGALKEQHQQTSSSLQTCRNYKSMGQAAS